MCYLNNNNVFAGDAAKGKTLFTKCKACHNVDSTKHKVGPHLVTLLSQEPEIQYVALRSMRIFTEKRPSIL